MCGLIEYLLPLILAAFLIGVVPSIRLGFQFQEQLSKHISTQELSKQGLIDGETGGLAPAYVINRRFLMYQDSELSQFGEAYRRALLRAIWLAVALIVIVAAVSSRNHAFLSCYAI
jgi:hypothetical protein